MSFKASLIKLAIKLTPDIVVRWVANFILKGIAELSAFHFDLEARTAYVQGTLYGESEPIEVWLEDFVIESDAASHRLVIHRAKANKPWLNNLLARIAGKAWSIPAIPQFHDEIELASELFRPEAAASSDSESE